MEEIIIDIDETGNVKVEGKGFRDGDCLKLTKDIEDALGTIEKRSLKPEARVAKTVLRKKGA